MSLLNFSSSIIIQASPEKVYHWLTDFHSYKKWLITLQESEILEGEMRTVGFKAKMVMKEFGHNLKITHLVKEIVPNELFIFTMDQGGAVVLNKMYLTAEKNNTRLSIEAEVNPIDLAMKMVLPGLMPMLKKKQEDDFERLRGLIEADPT